MDRIVVGFGDPPGSVAMVVLSPNEVFRVDSGFKYRFHRFRGERLIQICLVAISNHVRDVVRAKWSREE